MLLFDFQAVLFLENPRIRQPFAQNPSAGQQIEPLPKFHDKNPVQRYRKIIHNFVHGNWYFNVSYVYSQIAVCDRAFAFAFAFASHGTPSWTRGEPRTHTSNTRA